MGKYGKIWENMGKYGKIWENMGKYGKLWESMGKYGNWLVVLTILKNISQWEGLSHILWKIKNVPNHQPGKKSGSMIFFRKTILRRIHIFLNFEAG